MLPENQCHLELKPVVLKVQKGECCSITSTERTVSKSTNITGLLLHIAMENTEYCDRHYSQDRHLHAEILY